DQEGDDGAGRAETVAIEKMELLGVFIAARAFDQAQAEETDIEIDIGLHVAGHQGDVVDAACGNCRHDRFSSLRQSIVPTSHDRLCSSKPPMTNSAFAVAERQKGFGRMAPCLW